MTKKTKWGEIPLYRTMNEENNHQGTKITMSRSFTNHENLDQLSAFERLFAVIHRFLNPEDQFQNGLCLLLEDLFMQ